MENKIDIKIYKRKINKFMKNFLENNGNPELYNKWILSTNQNYLKELLKGNIFIRKKKKKKVMKKGRTPYIIFCQENRQSLVKEYPDFTQRQIASLLGVKWKHFKKNNITELERLNDIYQKERQLYYSAKKMKNKNKRGRTSYLIFCSEYRPIFIKKFPELLGREITIKLAEFWKQIKNDPIYAEKLKQYEHQSLIERNRYKTNKSKQIFYDSVMDAADAETVMDAADAETVMGAETDAETVMGAETDAETVMGAETETESVMGAETETESVMGAETDAESVMGAETDNQSIKAYKTFYTHNKNVLKKLYPTLKSRKIHKILLKKWSKLSQESRNKYNIYK